MFAENDDAYSLPAADPQVLSRRIEFVRARRPSIAPAVSARVRILNPRRDALGAAGQGDDTHGAAASLSGGTAARAQRPQFLFPPEQLLAMLRWPSVRGAGPGLSNLGQTCFMNAILQARSRPSLGRIWKSLQAHPLVLTASPPQALAYTPPLANLCRDRCHSRSCRAFGFCAFCELEVLVASMHVSTARALSPTSIAQKLRLIARHFRLGRQQDAHEFFLCLLEKLQAAALESAGAKGREAEPIAQTTDISQVNPDMHTRILYVSI